MSRTPSLKTVASAVGVSVATVSNAYNKPEHLSAALRERIFATARELGYAGPDAAARSLRSGRTGAIGVLSTTELPYAFTDPYCATFLAGLAEVVEQHQNSMLLMPLASRISAAPAQVQASVEAVRNAVIDGVVIDGIDDGHPALEVVINRGLPRVRSTDDPASRCVLIEDQAAARQLGAYLAAFGHRDVALIAASTDEPGTIRAVADDRTLYPYARLRLRGLREGLASAARVSVIAAGPNRAEDARVAAGRLLRGHPRPTAIVATSDVFALGVLAALQELDLRPGLDVSVTGFDDIPAAAAAGLTTVRQPIREKGRLMGRMLLDPSLTEQRIVLSAELVTRISTGPAPSANPGI
ncbi:MAG TPA: LacI family DNA-binding transcriptional regulator [Streptosporangiaceae bacterium]|jgi:DNA-binding LacI/PurR family transcriptional regulator